MKGIRRHGQGWEARVSVAGMPRSRQPFPIDTPDAEMQAWRRTERARLELQRGEAIIVGRLPAGTFAWDAQRYLQSVMAMPDYKGRCYDIGLWVTVFGSRRTFQIKPHEIRAQRDKWLTIGPKKRYDKKTRAWVEHREPLAASTVNHRLRALQNLYTVLYPQGYNPVKDVPEAVEPTAMPRSQPYELLETILAAMPDRGAASRGQKRPTISKSKARLRLMAFTGLTHKQVGQLEPGDLIAEPPAVRAPDRGKGKGSAGGWLPLPTDATHAINGFIAADAFGTFSRHSLSKSWYRACKTVDVRGVRPYDLRHSYATSVLATTGDLKATQKLLNHGSAKTTERYALHAIPAWLSAAAGKVTLAHSSGPIENGTEWNAVEKNRTDETPSTANAGQKRP